MKNATKNKSKRNIKILCCIVFIVFHVSNVSAKSKSCDTDIWINYSTEKDYLFCQGIDFYKKSSFVNFFDLAKDNTFNIYKKRLINNQFIDYCLINKRYKEALTVIKPHLGIPVWLDSEEYLYKSAIIFKSLDAYNYMYKYLLTALSYNEASHLQILYYLGVSSIFLEKYQEAIEFLSPLKKIKEYKDLARLNILYCFYKKKNFITTLNLNFNSESLNTECEQKKKLIIAESALMLNQLPLAIDLYDEVKKNINNDDNLRTKIFYRLGYLYYKKGEISKAIEALTHVIKQKDLKESLYAMFYLGQINIKNKKFFDAKSIFELLDKKTNHLLVINEHAIYNLIISLFMTKDYLNVIKQTALYKNRYKNGKYLSCVDEILCFTYINLKKQELAINYLETIENKSKYLIEIYQYLVLEEAKMLFNKKQYPEALNMVEKALCNHTNNLNFQNAILLKMIIYLNLKDYNNLLSFYNYWESKISASNFVAKANYILAYMHLNKQDYETAVKFFKRCMNANLNVNYTNDIGLRLADSYYALKKYRKAIDLYSLYMYTNPNHALYYTALAYKWLNELEMADSTLEKLVLKQSDIYDKAIFEKARINVLLGRYEKAINFYTELINKKSSLMFESMIERAVIFFNKKNYSNAKEDYLNVLKDSSDLHLKNSAEFGLKQVLTETNSKDNFNNYLLKDKGPDNIILDKFEKGCLLFYEKQQYKEALTTLEPIIKNLKDGDKKIQASFICAECYYKNNNINKAIEYYNVCLNNENKFKIKSLLKLAEIYESKHNYTKSLELYVYINQSTKKESAIFRNSLQGMIRNSFYLKKYDDSQKFINDYAISNNLYDASSLEVLIIFSKIAIEKSNFSKAISILEKIIHTNKIKSAEAIYLLAFVYYKEKKYETSLNLLLSKSVSFWRESNFKDKIFILIAKNYLSQELFMQAKATLNSIIDNCKNSEIIQEARMLMIEVETLENAHINSNANTKTEQTNQ